MDLSPPRTLNDTLHLLKNIFDCHDTSILSNEERHADLIQVRNQLCKFMRWKLVKGGSIRLFLDGYS